MDIDPHLTDMTDAHLSTECVWDHPELPSHTGMKYAMTNVKWLLEDLLKGQLADYKAANEGEEIDLTTADVKVFRRFPRRKADYPCISINRSGNEQSLSGLGEVISQDGDKEVRAIRNAERIEIQVYALNEDIRDALYAYVNQTINAYRPELARYGVETIMLVDGSDDEVDDQQFTESYLYRGTLVYHVTGETRIEDTYVMAKAVHSFVSKLLGGGETTPGSESGG